MVLRYDVCYDTCPHGYCNPQLKEEKTSEFSLIIVKPLPVKKIMSQPFFCPSPIPTRRASKSLVRFSENANENSLNIWRFQLEKFGGFKIKQYLCSTKVKLNVQ